MLDPLPLRESTFTVSTFYCQQWTVGLNIEVGTNVFWMWWELSNSGIFIFFLHYYFLSLAFSWIYCMKQNNLFSYSWLFVTLSKTPQLCFKDTESHLSTRLINTVEHGTTHNESASYYSFLLNTEFIIVVILTCSYH